MSATLTQETPMNYRLNVRLDDDFRQAVQEKADSVGLTLSEVVRALLEAWLKDEIQISLTVTQKQDD